MKKLYNSTPKTNLHSGKPRNNNLKIIVLLSISFILFSFLFIHWTKAMTVKWIYQIEFYLIFIPLIVFLIIEHFIIYLIYSSKRNKKNYKLLCFLIIPILSITFLFFSFAETKNKLCIYNNCIDGFGEAIYIVDERSYHPTNTKKFYHYEPGFLGFDFYNNVSWYSKNYNHYYSGEYKKGRYHGNGELFYNIRYIGDIYIYKEKEYSYNHLSNEAKKNNVSTKDYIKILENRGMKHYKHTFGCSKIKGKWINGFISSEDPSTRIEKFYWEIEEFDDFINQIEIKSGKSREFLFSEIY